MDKIIIYGQPFGKQRPKITMYGGIAHAYTPKETVNYEALIKHEYMAQCGKFYEKDQPLELWITAYFEVPKSWGKKKTKDALLGFISPTKKPDWDNIGKIISDALNKVAFHDDAQIVNAYVVKKYSHRPRVEIRIREVTHNGNN